MSAAVPTIRRDTTRHDATAPQHRPALLDVLLAACALAVTVLAGTTINLYGPTWYWACEVAIHVGLSGLLLVRRIYVRVSFVGTYTLLALLAAVVGTAPLNLGVSPLILCAPLALHTAARRLPAPWGVVGLLLGIAGTFISPASRMPGGADRALIPLMILVMVATYLAASAERRTEMQHAARIERERRELLQAGRQRELQARAEERTRIAREIHDVVGHSLTVTGVQARTALAIGDEAALRCGLEAVRDSSADALAQLRSLVSVLRSDEAAPLTALGDLLRLPDFVGDAESAGLQVEADLPPAEDLAAWNARWATQTRLAVLRILQEGLTNALRHGTGPVRVHVRETDGQCAVELANPTASRRVDPGNGLTGLHERVDLLEGRLDVRIDPGAPPRFVLAARIPVEPWARPDTATSGHDEEDR